MTGDLLSFLNESKNVSHGFVGYCILYTDGKIEVEVLSTHALPCPSQYLLLLNASNRYMPEPFFLLPTGFMELSSAPSTPYTLLPPYALPPNFLCSSNNSILILAFSSTDLFFSASVSAFCRACSSAATVQMGLSDLLYSLSLCTKSAWACRRAGRSERERRWRSGL